MKNVRIMKWLVVTLTITAGLVFTIPANALQINVAFQGNNGPGGPPPTITGPGAIGNAGDVWNLEQFVGGPSTPYVDPNLLDVSNNLTGVSITFANFIGGNSFGSQGGDVVASYAVMAYGTAYTHPASIVFSNLPPNSFFDCYLFGSNARLGAGGKFFINGNSKETTGGNPLGQASTIVNGPPYYEYLDYVSFKGIQCDAYGVYTILLDGGNYCYLGPDLASSYCLGIFNAVQLVSSQTTTDQVQAGIAQGVGVSWPSDLGKLYQVEWTANLLPSNTVWSPLGSPLPGSYYPGTSPTNTLFDAFGTSTHKFYRVLRVPPSQTP